MNKSQKPAKNPLQLTYLLFDIDYTLINTSVLIHSFIVTIIRSPHYFIRSVRMIYTLLTKEHKQAQDSSLFSGTCFETHNYTLSIYPDVLPTLSVLALKKQFILGIFSQAVPNFQLLKIECSGLSSFFSRKHIYISRDKKKLAKMLLPGLGIDRVVVIDDRVDVVTYLVALGVQSILLDRNSDKICPQGAFRIHSLLELPSLLDTM